MWVTRTCAGQRFAREVLFYTKAGARDHNESRPHPTQQLPPARGERLDGAGAAGLHQLAVAVSRGHRLRSLLFALVEPARARHSAPHPAARRPVLTAVQSCRRSSGCSSSWTRPMWRSCGHNHEATCRVSRETRRVRAGPPSPRPPRSRNEQGGRRELRAGHSRGEVGRDDDVEDVVDQLHLYDAVRLGRHRQRRGGVHLRSERASSGALRAAPASARTSMSHGLRFSSIRMS